MLSFTGWQKFGVEIEFYGALRSDVYYMLEKKGYIGLGWIVKPEEQMSCDDGSLYRGEITSPILTNNVEDLKSLKEVLEITRDTYARANHRCGAHVHFDAERLAHDNVRFLQNLLLLHMCYEDIIFKFSAGRMPNIRKSIYSYASPLIEKLRIEDIKEYIYDDIDYTSFYYSFVESTTKNSSLNLLNLRPGGFNTIEFRTPDGTLDEFIWFNNINLFGLMIDYATKMDINTRDYLYKEIVRKKKIGFDHEFINVDKAKEFIRLIKKNENDEISFMKQYKKEF